MRLRGAAPALDEAQAHDVEQRIASIERRCGVEIVCAVYARSDAYPEAPWHAFAFGTVITAAVAVWLDLLHPAWIDAATLLAHVVAVLTAGGLCGLLTLAWSAWARMFVDPLRREARVRERAKVLFVDRALFATRRRNAVLILASLFERKVEIIADRALDDVGAASWQRVIEAMAPFLGEGRCQAALLAGLEATEELLVERGFASAAERSDELPNALVQGGST